MNSYVGAAAQGGKEKKVDLRLPEQLLRVFFFFFLWAKKIFFKYSSVHIKKLHSIKMRNN